MVVVVILFASRVKQTVNKTQPGGLPVIYDTIIITYSLYKEFTIVFC